MNNMDKINVTKTFLPPLEEYNEYLKKIWESGWLTNQGPLLKQFEEVLSKHLNISGHLQFVANGTLALQIALEALGIRSGEIITTPFSYVATTSAILWQGAKPVYVDVEKDSFNIDPDKIERAITPETKAILAVHVFGNPCNIEAIDKIAKKHNLKVVYDAAHAFGVQYKQESLLNFGDISTCSFHATKLFHTIEGGCIISKDKGVQERVELKKRFGHNKDNHYMLGINAKATEFQAAMGLCNLPYMETLINNRKEQAYAYNNFLNDDIKTQKINKETRYNFSYYPVVLESEAKTIKTIEKLNANNIFPRRYFYPSLNALPYVKDAESCPVSEDISKRVLCLPLYQGLESSVIKKICEVVNEG